MTRMKRRVHEILEVADPGDRKGRLFDIILMLLIILNVVAVILETVEELFSTYDPLFRAFDLFSVAVFSVEYLLRVWSCTADEEFAAHVRGRLRWWRWRSSAPTAGGESTSPRPLKPRGREFRPENKATI